ncbi:helix-turn-helix domain-containing protein, partial [[Clostridium] scindens]
MNYVTGYTIRRLREKKGITQKQLADMLAVSDCRATLSGRHKQYFIIAI